MNRRTAALTALAAFAVLTGGTVAQATPVGTPEATPTQSTPEATDIKGLLVNADRTYEAGGFGIGALRYDLTVLVFGTEASAEAGYDRTAEVLDMLATEGYTVTDRAEVSAPKVGERRYAEKMQLAKDGETFAFAIARAVEGRVVHVWIATGLGDPTLDLVTLAEKHMRFGNVDTARDADVLALLPALDEMPAGFTLDDEGIDR